MNQIISNPVLSHLPEGCKALSLAFLDLPHWAEQDFKAIFATFLVSCRAIVSNEKSVRPAQDTNAALRIVCEKALLGVPANSPADIRSFFESYFKAYRIIPESGAGFLTAYYEPEVEGSLTRTTDFSVPLLGRPEGLISIKPGDSAAHIDASLVSARQLSRNGRISFEALPDRGLIEDGALDHEGLELIWLRDRVELFMIHVQGSTRVRLADGSSRRFTYAGRNGYPYTSIGKQIVAEGHMPLETMTLDRLKVWLRQNPVEAKRIMRLNRSYIFFAPADYIPANMGPIGGSGVSLTPHYSIAIDRTLWPYGLPFFLETDLPKVDNTTEKLAHMMIGQDTGSAILGAARADYFMGSGDEAGVRAGLVRHKMQFSVLWPFLPDATK